MRKINLFLLSVLAVMIAAALLAQGNRASPHEKVTATIAGKAITIEYGRPFMKGRTIYGGLVPFGKVWRTGADEATMLTAEGDLMIGSLHVPKGSYSLFTIPGEKEWTLVVNKVAKQWGAYKYEQGSDLGRVTMKVESLSAPVEQLTIAINSKGGNQGEIRVSWEKTAASAGIMVH